VTWTRENAGAGALEAARALTGKPYVYGGTWPQSGGTDCDGLTTYGYACVGIIRHRPTYVDFLDQPWDQRNGHRDDPNQPGDLLYYLGSDSPGNGLPGHVAFYVSPGRIFQAEMTGVPIGEFDGDTVGYEFRCRPALALPAPPPPPPVPGSPFERLGPHARPQGPLPVLHYKAVTPEQVPFLYFARQLLNAAKVVPTQPPRVNMQYGRLTADRVIRWKRKHDLPANATIGIRTWATWGVHE